MSGDSQPGRSEVLRGTLDALAHDVLGLAEVIAMPQDDDPRLIGQQHFMSPDPTSTAHFDGRHFGGESARLPDGLAEAAFAHLESGEAADGERWTVNVRYDDTSGSFVAEASRQERDGPVRKHTDDWMVRMALLYARALADDVQRGA